MSLPESEYECPICLEELISPIFQCYEGHLLCSTCIDKLTVCPICQQDMPSPSRRIRNREIEKVISSSIQKENCLKNTSLNVCLSRAKKCLPVIEVDKDEDGKNARASNVHSLPKSLPIKIQTGTIISGTKRPSAFSPPQPTTSKKGMEILGNTSSFTRLRSNGNNSNRTAPVVTNSVYITYSDCNENSDRVFRPQPLSVNPTDQLDLINFIDDIPNIPSPHPPQTKLLACPLPPPVPPRRK